MTKWMVTIIQGVSVEADTPLEAEEHALVLVDGGFAEVIGVEVEPLTREKGERE